jgi:hypothetical protein
MKNALVLLFAFAALSCAQEQDKRAEVVKKLGSVTWDLKNHKLIWVVQKGKTVNGQFQAAAEDRYEISPDEATMAFAQEKREFTEQEASSLHHLLDVLSLYCAESVVWWDEGEGTPVDPNAPAKPHRRQDTPTKPARPGDAPTKVEEQPRKVKIGPRDIVASLQEPQ